MAGQPEESIQVLTTLAKNGVLEKRYRDASYFYWLLSQITLDLNKSTEDMKAQFMAYYDKADIYYAYHEVYKYLVGRPCFFFFSNDIVTKYLYDLLTRLHRLLMYFYFFRRSRLPR